MLAATVQSLMPVLGQALAAALLAAGTWAATRLAQWLHISAEAEVRNYLLNIVRVAVDAAAATLRDHPALRDDVVREARDYVQESAPGALRRLGVSPAKLEEMIEQRLTPKGL